METWRNFITPLALHIKISVAHFKNAVNKCTIMR